MQEGRCCFVLKKLLLFQAIQMEAETEKIMLFATTYQRYWIRLYKKILAKVGQFVGRPVTSIKMMENALWKLSEQGINIIID